MKTNKKHFEIFKKECEYWYDIFELKNWNIDYYHLDREESLAWTKVNLDGRKLAVSLNKDWGKWDKITTEKVKNVAKHEMIHCLLGRLAELGTARYINQNEVYEAEEALVNKLSKLINN